MLPKVVVTSKKFYYQEVIVASKLEGKRLFICRMKEDGTTHAK